jgi:hypothetical protein
MTSHRLSQAGLRAPRPRRWPESGPAAPVARAALDAGRCTQTNRPPRVGARPSAPALAWILNGTLRAAIILFAIEAVLAGSDPRFDGKGIAVRDLILAGAACTLLVPAVHALRGHRRPYPVWADSLLLSIIVLDMVGNSLNLYSQPWRFDLVAHAYGPGAGVIALILLGVAWLPGALIVNAAHLLLEIQEALGDAVFGTKNVHGWWDTLTDLSVGLATSLALALVWKVRQSAGGGSAKR